jgi:hypothetical protein
MRPNAFLFEKAFLKINLFVLGGWNYHSLAAKAQS